MQQYFHLTGVLGRWLYAARRLALLERAIGSKPPRRWLYLAVFRNILVVILYKIYWKHVKAIKFKTYVKPFTPLTNTERTAVSIMDFQYK
ncbi:MAG: hypothetical protein VB064_04905, partial [Oscillospiraceae bacterium]|nr:hypothetical protein [Oscillospiraceae bacterium]